MINVKKVKPLFNRIVTTADRYEEVTEGGIIDATKSHAIKEFQRVLAVGTTVSHIKEGDLVLIDPSRYMVRKHREGSLKDGVIEDNPVTGFNFNAIDLNGEMALMLYDTDIIYVVEECEEIEDTPGIILPDKRIRLN